MHHSAATDTKALHADVRCCLGVALHAPLMPVWLLAAPLQAPPEEWWQLPGPVIELVPRMWVHIAAPRSLAPRNHASASSPVPCCCRPGLVAHAPAVAACTSCTHHQLRPCPPPPAPAAGPDSMLQAASPGVPHHGFPSEPGTTVARVQPSRAPGFRARQPGQPGAPQAHARAGPGATSRPHSTKCALIWHAHAAVDGAVCPAASTWYLCMRWAFALGQAAWHGCPHALLPLLTAVGVLAALQAAQARLSSCLTYPTA